MSSSIHSLPIHIIYLIFDRLNEKDLFIAANNVNQRLNAILNSYQRFKVNLTNILTSFACKLPHTPFNNIILTRLSAPKFSLIISRGHLLY